MVAPHVGELGTDVVLALCFVPASVLFHGLCLAISFVGGNIGAQKGLFAEGGERKQGSRMPFKQTGMYPKYYQNDFHFQTDGWFSSKSAEQYDSSAEVLFLGKQDAMQRATLIPIARCVP